MQSKNDIIQEIEKLPESLPQRCKSRGCCRSKASEGAAVVYYRKPLATKDMRDARLSRRVKNIQFFKILEFIWGRFQIFKSNFS